MNSLIVFFLLMIRNFWPGSTALKRFLICPTPSILIIAIAAFLLSTRWMESATCSLTESSQNTVYLTHVSVCAYLDMEPHCNNYTVAWCCVPHIWQQLHQAVLLLHYGDHEAGLLAHPLAPQVRNGQVEDTVLEHLSRDFVCGLAVNQGQDSCQTWKWNL